MGWLQKAWLDALIAGTAAGVIWVELIVWALTGRPADAVLTGAAGSFIALAGARAGWRIVSAGGQSSSPSSPSSPSPPPSPPLPGALNGD